MFLWRGADRVYRNIQMHVSNIELPTAEYKLRVHAWCDVNLNNIVSLRFWQHSIISEGEFYPFWLNRGSRLVTLDEAYTTLSTWTFSDLKRRVVLHDNPYSSKSAAINLSTIRLKNREFLVYNSIIIVR